MKRYPFSFADLNRACDAFLASRGQPTMTWAESRSRDIKQSAMRKQIRAQAAAEAAAMEIEEEPE